MMLIERKLKERKNNLVKIITTHGMVWCDYTAVCNNVEVFRQLQGLGVSHHSIAQSTLLIGVVV